MDPDTGNVFRFFEVEYSIACAMDGKRDVAGIVKWAQEELGLTPSAKEVQTVIATLADLRFIDGGATQLSDVPEARATAKASPPVVRDEHNEATVVGAAALPDDDLAPGIVVGAHARAAAPVDVELGHAGGAATAPRQEALPKADFDSRRARRGRIDRPAAEAARRGHRARRIWRARAREAGEARPRRICRWISASISRSSRPTSRRRSARPRS